MRSFNLVGVVAAVAMAVGCCPVADARSGDGAEVSRLTEWFLCGLNDVAAPEAVPDKRLRPEAVAAAQEMVWQAWRSANAAYDEEKLPPVRSIVLADSGVWHIPAELEADAAMKYYWGRKGWRPAEGYPLFLYLHGSGDPEGEWSNGLYFARTFADGPSVYFVPRIPRTGEYYRWWQRGKQYAWEKLLRQAMAGDDVDPDRIYFFGISEGGYGSQRLASFYADYLAGAGPMAGGEPLANAPAENCRNIAFSLRTGEEDYGFYRNRLTGYTREAFDSLQRLSPEDFVHDIELIPGRDHGIDYRPTTPWLSGHKRNPWPSRVSWEDYEMDGIHRRGFYNLQVVERPDSLRRTRYEMTIADNVVDLTVDNVDYQTTETDPYWGIALKFERSYTPATSGKVRIYFNDRLVDLSRPVTVNINGRMAYRGRLNCTLANLAESCALYADPRRLFPASITLSVGE